MTPSRPYLIRAMYEWMLDNGMTPHLVVLADYPGVSVPVEFVKEGKIVLNISPAAVRNLALGNEEITFTARFSGRSMNIVVPVLGAIAIYTRENGKGMVFTPEEQAPPPNGAGTTSTAKTEKPRSRASLKVVK